MAKNQRPKGTKAVRGRVAKGVSKAVAPPVEMVDFQSLHRELSHIWTVLAGVRVRKGKAVPARLLDIITAVETLQDETECQINMLIGL